MKHANKTGNLTMKVMLTAAFVATSTLALSGCIQAPTATPQTVGIATTGLQMNSVNVIDRRILTIRKTVLGEQYDYGKVLVESSGAARTETGTLAVHTTLQNLTDHPQTLQARARFYDESKFPIEDFSAWQRLNLPPKGVATYREMSLSNRAAFFYIEVKEG